MTMTFEMIFFLHQSLIQNVVDTIYSEFIEEISQKSKRYTYNTLTDKQKAC